MLLAWRFSRTFASRFNFANVVFFLPAKVDLQVVQANRGAGRHDGEALSTVLRPAGRATSPGRLATSRPNAPSAQRAEASRGRRGRRRILGRRLQHRPSANRSNACSPPPAGLPRELWVSSSWTLIVGAAAAFAAERVAR